MTDVLILKKRNHEMSQEEMEVMISKYRGGIINNFDYDLGYLNGRLGDNGQKELNNLMIGYLLLGVTLANEEKLKLKVKKSKKVSEESSYLG